MHACIRMGMDERVNYFNFYGSLFADMKNTKDRTRKTENLLLFLSMFKVWTMESIKILLLLIK